MYSAPLHCSFVVFKKVLAGGYTFVDKEDFLMVSRGGMILAQPFNTSDKYFDSFTPITINQTGYTAFDYDSRDGYIYWIGVGISASRNTNVCIRRDKGYPWVCVLVTVFMF